MASTTFDEPLSEYLGPSTATAFCRNDDPLSQALRGATAISIEDIVRLDRISFPSSDGLSTTTPSVTAIFSDREGSTVTRPTSTDTYFGCRGKGKFRSTGYTSSLSGSNGSASEAEVERSTLRRHFLRAVGDWSEQAFESSAPLKGTIGAKERLSRPGKSKGKKPFISLDHAGYMRGNAHRNPGADRNAVKIPVSHRPAGKKIVRRRTTHHGIDLIPAPKRSDSQPDPSVQTMTESWWHICTVAIAALSGMSFTTVAFAIHEACGGGRVRPAYIKIVIFSATTLMACFTVFSMLIAKWAPSGTQLASILIFLFGLALMIALDGYL